MLPDWMGTAMVAVLEATGGTSVDELSGEVLRRWGSSEVWRLSAAGGSVIVKRGSDSQAVEADAYERYVLPLGLPAPELLHVERTAGTAVLVLADVGAVTLEQQPSEAGYLAAADLLAEIRRNKPAQAVTGFGPDRLVELAKRVKRGVNEPLLDQVAKVVGPALEELHRTTPPAVVHGDFVPKNLVTDGSRWTAVDWPSAYVAPHLADLYTLLRESPDPEPIEKRYVVASGTEPDLVRRQVVVGGVCFSLLALTWILDEGLRTVPESADWIDGLLRELDQLTTEAIRR
jgi:hypothetical protein